MSPPTSEIKAAREPYEAPMVEEMPIEPDESMLISCKSTLRGTGQGNFTSCNVTGSCRKS